MSTTKRNEPLSPIDWVMPRSYISQILCFSASCPQVPQILKDGLAATLVDVPYLACDIVEGGQPKGSVMLAKTSQSLNDLFQIKDLSATTDYCSLKSAHFSPLLLDKLDVFHANLNVLGIGPLPVFRATISRVRNGHLLCVSVHHSTTDITGFGALLKLWASHCRTGSSKSVQFANICLDRERLLNTPTEPPARCPAFLHIRNDSKTGKKPDSSGFDDMESLIFNFQRQELQSLKAEVTPYLPDETTWVSTGDIVTAILWGAMVFAESQYDARFGQGTTPFENGERSIRIPVNFRSRYRPALPKDYIGAAFGISLATAKESDLRHIATAAENVLFLSALASVAVVIRRAINLVDGENMRSVVHYLAAQKDLRNIELGPHNNSPSIVSWADEGIYDLDWGCKIGNCDAVRLLNLKNKRWPIVLPRRQNGDLEVFVRLETRQMEVLKNSWVMRLLEGASPK
jgi:trichothecene 3-O-acetyltransferase